MLYGKHTKWRSEADTECFPSRNDVGEAQFQRWFQSSLELAWGSASHPASSQTLRPIYVQLIQGVYRVSLSSDLMWWQWTHRWSLQVRREDFLFKLRLYFFLLNFWGIHHIEACYVLQYGQETNIIGIWLFYLIWFQQLCILSRSG